MFVRPSNGTTQELALKLSEARDKKNKSSLDQPKFAAEHLKTKEDLNMFYGESHDAEATIAVVIAAKAVAAASAMVSATLLAACGPTGQLTSKLDNLYQNDLESFSIEGLLATRNAHLG